MRANRPAGWTCLVLLGLAIPARSFAQSAVVLEPSAETVEALSARAPDDVQDLREIQEQVQRVVAQVLPATVSVEIDDAAGSGVIVSADGLILTAAHVISRPGRRAWIELPDGRRLRGRTLGADHEADAGMIQLDAAPADLPFAPIALDTTLELGEWVVTTGQPGGLVTGRAPPVRLGRVLFRDDDVLCTDSKLVGGDSGGPLFNMRGEVVGIHSSIGPNITHNFHVPIEAFRRSWDRLKGGELWGGRYDELRDDGRPVLGVSGNSVGGRCVITDVTAGLPAAKAGVRVGDVVIAVDGRPVDTFEQLRDIISFKTPGDRLSLTIQRAGETLELRAQLSLPDGSTRPIGGPRRQVKSSSNPAEAILPNVPRMKTTPSPSSTSLSRRLAVASCLALAVAAGAVARLGAQGPPPRRGDLPGGGAPGGEAPPNGQDERGPLDGEDSDGPGDEGEGFDDSEDDGLPFDTDRLFVPRWRLTNGPQVRAAFRDVVDEIRAATVAIHCDGKRQGLGGIVGADGWILTKATPLCEGVLVILADGRQLPGVVVGENGRYDLALIKVTAQNLPTVNLTDATVPEVGSWLASVGLDRDPAAVGIVSVAPREIPPQPGVLGVQLDRTDANRPIVEQVFPGSAAEDAGIVVGDRIVRVDGVATPTRDELIERVRSFNPGDEVTLSVVREGRTMTIQATLGGVFPGIEGRSEFQNNLGGQLSVRRYGFPVALQHDTVLRPDEVGGPVVDLDGRVIGFNVARAGRTETYAIPTSAVREVLDGLMTSGLAALLKIEKEATEDAGADPTSGPAPETPPAPVLPADEAASAYEDEGYQLVWFDEFDAKGAPDTAKWTYERGFVRNEELQWYQPENAVCDDGLLMIEARREQVENPRYNGFSRSWQEHREFAEFTSTSMLTRGLASWMYGRFEMRGRIDVRPGLWPAWWTLGVDGRWPAGGEIDVMEYYRGMLLANAAWAGEGRWQAKWDDSRTPLAELGDNWADHFHVWRMDWDEERIALSVDGRELNTVDLTETINETSDGDNPFHQPHYMILNLAIGGTNGGEPKGTEFPARFEVDYVRVYQK